MKIQWPTRASALGDELRQTAEWLCYDHAARSAAGKRVLDCDCGPGYGSWLLWKAGAARVVGVTSDPAALAWASAEFASPSIQFREGGGRSLPLASADVDVAVSLETLERLRDAPAFIEELHRVIAPGGYLILSTALTRGERRLHPQDPLHVREYDDVELAALLAPHFSIASRSGLVRPPGPLRRRDGGVTDRARRAVESVLPRGVLKLGGSLMGGPPPTARIVEVGWEEAPVQLALARRVGDGLSNR